MQILTFAVPLPPVVSTFRVVPSPTPAIEPADKEAAPADAAIATPVPPDRGNQASITNQPAATVSLPRLTWQSWLLLAWSGIVIAQIIRLLWQRQRLRRLLSRSAPADSALAGLVAELASQIGLGKVPRVVVTPSDCSPFVCGVRHAVLVMPAGLATTLSSTELRHVLLHELAHVRRRDLVWGWINELARVVYFFHPVAHWIAYRARLERELACDQMAMAHSGHDAREYAATLVRVVSHSSEPSVFKTAAVSAGLDGDMQ
jgi:beta-lactamase regulating signal transducer with metallopeptidase domain